MITRNYTITTQDFPPAAKDALLVMEKDLRLKKAVFFDIETTGFSAAKNAIYLIGCCWYAHGKWQLTQWLAADATKEEQTLILDAFFICIQPFEFIVTYNGATFDLPFLEKKGQALNTEHDFAQWTHIDLYKDIRPLKKLLALENLKLKTVEAFLDIHREDEYSGGALIPVFEVFAKTGNSSLQELLLLHNYEDIKDMLFILPLLSYHWFFAGNVALEHVLPKDSHIEISLKPVLPLPKELQDLKFNLNDQQATLRVGKDFATLYIPVYSGELKYFYDNYKEYYYLPNEDCAIHKSVAKYVDKDHRQKATAKNCYTKKAGVFLPQIQRQFTPAFKSSQEDTFTWFEYDDTVFTTDSFITYVQSFLRLPILGNF